MLVGGFASRTRQACSEAIAKLAGFHPAGPTRLTAEPVEAWLLHRVRDRKLSCSPVNQAAGASSGQPPHRPGLGIAHSPHISGARGFQAAVQAVRLPSAKATGSFSTARHRNPPRTLDTAIGSGLFISPSTSGPAVRSNKVYPPRSTPALRLNRSGAADKRYSLP
ncbi:MAG: hypothetical protein ACRESZ_12890 [Methylococcales bacterium]